MGEESLVGDLMTKAERIAPRLWKHGITVLAAFLAFEIEASQWMFLVVTAKEDSKLAVYDAVQSTAHEVGDYINLGQVVHVRDGDPAIELFQAAAISQRYAKSYPPVEFGSWSFTEIRAVNLESWRVFEIEVFDAIKEVAPSAWSMEFSSRPDDFPPLQLDILIRAEHAAIAVEVKSYKRPVDTEVIFAVLGKLQVLKTLYRGAKMLLVSRSGFSNSALAAAEPFEDLRLLSWESVKVNGLKALRKAIYGLITAK
ncbi:restriction endonuclease [Nocardia sp. NPDC004068]|uniref:restriction endonuclease n=1 Tax=Nocardia sp. NPDC004068 TaxID=3364303 RepID=UPI0036B4D35D